MSSVGPAYNAYASLFTGSSISGIDVFDEDSNAEKLSRLLASLKIEDPHRMVLAKRFQIWKMNPTEAFNIAFTAMAPAAVGGGAAGGQILRSRNVGRVAAAGVGFLRAFGTKGTKPNQTAQPTTVVARDETSAALRSQMPRLDCCIEPSICLRLKGG